MFNKRKRLINQQALGALCICLGIIFAACSSNNTNNTNVHDATPKVVNQANTTKAVEAEINKMKTIEQEAKKGIQDLRKQQRETMEKVDELLKDFD